MNDPTPGRPDKIDEILRIYRLVKVTPGLAMPTVSPARATFDYRDVIYTREDVASAVRTLHRAFGLTFAPGMVLAGDDTPRYLLETDPAQLSGLALVVISRFEHAWSAAPCGQCDERANAGELVAA